MAADHSAPQRPFSPCTHHCEFDGARGRCRSCHRTMDEIVGWIRFTPAQRERVWQRIERSLKAETEEEARRSAGADPDGAS